MDLSIDYMGLKLKNPIIVGSSGLTNNVESIIKLEKAGAGAIIVKSLFEEQIMMEIDSYDTGLYYVEGADYLSYFVKDKNLKDYLDTLKNAKEKTDIPIIASINCTTSTEWINFAKDIEATGADGIELNIFIIPSNIDQDSLEIEKKYFEIIKGVLAVTNIPVAVKISPYFSSLAKMIKKLSETGVKGMVLFNRFFSPDIDIENMNIISSDLYSSSHELSLPLRWIGLMSPHTKDCDISASTGVHTGYDIVKVLLVGAKAAQVTSTLYKNGLDHIEEMLKELKVWMTRHNFNKISDFQGTLAADKAQDNAVYERSQFIKYYTKHEV